MRFFDLMTCVAICIYEVIFDSKEVYTLLLFLLELEEYANSWLYYSAVPQKTELLVFMYYKCFIKLVLTYSFLTNKLFSSVFRH